MNQFLKYFLCLILLTAEWSVMAQPIQYKYRDRLGDSVRLVDLNEPPERIKRAPLLTKSLSGGVQVRTDGWALFMDMEFLYGHADFGNQNYNTHFQERLVELSFGEIKHPKEVKTNSNVPGMPFEPGGYILGKINSFYQANLGYGYRRLIAGKPDNGTVSIHWTYLGGFSGGLLKPYYLNLMNQGLAKYSKDIESDFIAQSNIMGKAKFSEGLDEVEFVPGLFLKTGLHFDFTKRKKALMGIETGLTASYYFKEVPQMVGQDVQQLFYSFYLSIQIGGRW